MNNTRSKEEIEKVWNAFKQMKTYIDKSAQVLCSVDKANYYTNEKGKKMYDGVSTLLNANIGHCNEDLIQTINEQLGQLDNTTMFTSTNDISIECSKKMCSLTDNHYYASFFTNSGSEGCDTAIKIVRKYWKNKGEDKMGIVSLKGAYHGSSIGAMMLAHEGYKLSDYGITYDGFYQVSAPDSLNYEDESKEEAIQTCIDEFEDLLSKQKGKIGAFFIELIQLSNAVNVLPISYVQEIYKICQREKILLVIDEVATGFGRTGSMFAYEQYGIKSDLMMFAKGVTSGYFPMGGVLVTKEVYKSFWGEPEEHIELCHGYTTGGHPVACAAALKNINIIEENNLSENANLLGSYLLNKLQESCGNSKLVKMIRGKGLMISLIFNDIKIPGMQQWGIADIMSKFLATRGLLLYPDDVNILIVAPPLTIDQAECDMVVNIIADCIKKIEFTV